MHIHIKYRLWSLVQVLSDGYWREYPWTVKVDPDAATRRPMDPPSDRWVTLPMTDPAGAGIYGNIYHQYTPNVSIYYTIHGSYGLVYIWMMSENGSYP